MASSQQHAPSDPDRGDEVGAAEIRSDRRLERRFLFSGILAFAAAGVVILIRHVLGSL
jgi:hypothetical protein